MDRILENAKLVDWMKSFSEVDLPKPTRKKRFRWMEYGIVPFWMFPDMSADIADRVLDVEDDAYFDVYNVDHHPLVKKVFCSGPKTPGKGKRQASENNDYSL